MQKVKRPQMLRLGASFLQGGKRMSSVWHYWWPLFLIVFSNVLYNLSAKNTPPVANPFLSLSVTYFVGTLATIILFFATSEDRNILQGALKLNWTSLLLGASIVGLETGYIFLYRAGWNISKGPLTANILLSSILLIIGAVVFRETVTLRQLVGIGVCFAGLFLISTK